MSTDISAAIAGSIVGSEEHWAAWAAKGLRRRWLVALPILGVLAGLPIGVVLIGARP